MTHKPDIRSLIQKKVLVLDGAMGTMIQKKRLSEDDFRGDRFNNHPSNLQGNNDILCITKPEIIKQIHEAFLNAGADIIETNTFNANSISQLDYNTEDCVIEINREAAKIAREAADAFTLKTRTNQGMLPVPLVQQIKRHPCRPT